MSAHPPPPDGSAPYGQPGAGSYGSSPYGPPAALPPYGQGGHPVHAQPVHATAPYGQPQAFGQPAPQQWAQPTPPGFIPTGPRRRPWMPALIGFGALAAFGLVCWGLSTDDPPVKTAREASVGDCLENRGSHAKPVLFAIDCSNTKAKYRIVSELYNSDAVCPAKYDQYKETGGRLGDENLCLDRVHR
ncbi:hypothetical protein [Streptomyces sp. NPDC048650]|uniref:LppU/SCO3897 family protein n=1 Tax=unclassified Streptomyces TaxID=2593676 RepID=UPI00371F25DC